MGLVALVGVRVEAQLGERRGIALGLMMILLACLARWVIGPERRRCWSRRCSAVPGVALIQALVPAMIKREFHHRVPVAIGVYSASLMAGGGLAALLSPLVATQFEDWQAGSGVWLLPALGALLLWAWLPLGAAKMHQAVPAFKGLRRPPRLAAGGVFRLGRTAAT